MKNLVQYLKMMKNWRKNSNDQRNSRRCTEDTFVHWIHYPDLWLYDRILISHTNYVIRIHIEHMAKLILSSFKRFLFTYDWEIVEIQGATFKIMWGVWLLSPFQTFRTIAGYNQVASENTWGWGLLLLGLIHLIAILSKNRIMRIIMCMIAFLFWTFTVILVAQQLWTSAIVPMFSVIAFFMGINFTRLVLDKPDQRGTDLGPLPGHPERRMNV